ncbi:Uncharacterized membrane protein [Halovenus aranensis]|jgi:uncharacterized membrane protein|uniref:Uncharacterized membrane protein n=1 Tax=Halovenus aranensis TaxID=890420 RepID=A0A1G8W8F9_9EURY|nr:DUF63 family protein [Halovenus aranensis]SDJ74559.1 Uncharacterized membrane protein [Halovenus aranensis]
MTAPFGDLVFPPLAQSLLLLVGAGVLVALLYVIRPPVNQRTVLAFIPWMVAGSVLHVFYQIGEIFQVEIYPPGIAPLFAAPSVYISTFVAMGIVWVISAMVVPGKRLRQKVPQYLAATGIGIATPLVALVFWQGLDPEVAPMEPIWPVFGLLISLVLTAIVYFGIGAWRTYIIARAKYVGALVIFAHMFDGVTTAIGVDVLEAGERSQLPRIIMDFAADLPTADLLGQGWLFVVFKVVLASAIVAYFSADLTEHESQTNLLFAFVIALGFGPAIHNFFLFVLAP